MKDKDLSLKSVRHFVLDECDKMLEMLGERPRPPRSSRSRPRRGRALRWRGG